MSNFSIREGESMSQDPSLMPRTFTGPMTQGGVPDGAVPVMKVGLNDPTTKSIVMSTTEFSDAELAIDPPAPKPKKKKVRRRNQTQRAAASKVLTTQQ